MSLEVVTQDSSALSEQQLEEMLSVEGAFGQAELARAKDDWVLCTLARVDGKLHGVTFSTLERIGGTPGGRRNPWFQLISRQGRWVIDRSNKAYHVPVDALV